MWPVLVRWLHSFTRHPHTNHTCLYSPAAKHHRPLHLPTEGCPWWVDLGGWVVGYNTETGFLHRDLNRGPVIHSGINLTQRRVTSLIEALPLRLRQVWTIDVPMVRAVSRSTGRMRWRSQMLYGNMTDRQKRHD